LAHVVVPAAQAGFKFTNREMDIWNYMMLPENRSKISGGGSNISWPSAASFWARTAQVAVLQDQRNVHPHLRQEVYLRTAEQLKDKKKSLKSH
jgi:hypothetical protein